MDTSSPLSLYPDRDALFEEGPWPRPFQFNEHVARVFDDMVSRSVPMYREVVACAAHWTLAAYQPGTHIIDVGCSTGTFLELVGRLFSQRASLVGIDNAQPMLDRAQTKLAALQDRHHIELRCQDAEAANFSGSSVVVMNYTLQFLPVDRRKEVLSAVHRGLVPGGLLFLSEKVTSPVPQFQEILTRHYEAFKQSNGYARSEIERKKEALEHVLVPLTQQEQLQMLHHAGFREVDVLLKMHNFATFIARKSAPPPTTPPKSEG